MIIKAPEANFTLPSEGEYLARLSEVEDLGELDDRYNPGQTAHFMRLIWKLKNGARQFQRMRVSLHPLSNFYGIASALLCDNPPDEIDPETLIGKTAYITIEHSKGSDGRTWSNVTDVRPVEFKGRKLPPPEPEPREREQPNEQLVITDDDVPF